MSQTTVETAVPHDGPEQLQLIRESLLEGEKLVAVSTARAPARASWA